MPAGNSWGYTASYMSGYKKFKPNRVLLSGLALGLVLTISLSSGIVRADTVSRPYFKTFGSDIFSGGAFTSSINDTSCSSNYQYANSANPDDGGIFAFAKDSSGKAAGGASSQYAAFATGPVQGTSGSGLGLYSGGSQAGSVSFNYSTFANNSGSSWGGSFDGSVPQSDCIPDYYDKLSAYKTTTSWSPSSSSPVSNVYTANSAGDSYTLLNQDMTITSGRSVTIYVNGNVYINHNISYNLDTVDDVPKFVLVAKGDIYIDPSVTHLDGFYIAQPATSDFAKDDGNIWTCHGASSDEVFYNYTALISACNNKLTINGALVAKQVVLTRVNGDIGNASTGEDSSGGAGNNVAEVITYSPEMVIGGPFFNPPTVTNFKVESLISLPPVF